MKALIIGIVLYGIAVSTCAAAGGCAEQSKDALKPGGKVIAALAGPNWSVATVTSVSGKSYMVKYPDGGLGSLSSAEMVPYPTEAAGKDVKSCMKAGDKVLAKAKGDIWRVATIRAIDGKTISVIFQDTTRSVVSMTEIVRYPR